jgi:hypothetical protein
VEFSAFALFLYKAIESLFFRRIILITAIAFYIFAIGLYIDHMGSNQYSFDSFSASVEAILIVIYCILYLFDQMNKPQVLFIYQEPHFWFVVGFILYLSGTLFLFSQASNLEYQQRQDYWTINLFLNITKNILFAVAFSTKKSKPLNYNSENPFDTYP